MDKLVLSLGMPIYESIRPQTAASILFATRRLPMDVHVNFLEGSIVHESRNLIVDEAKRVEATHLLFVDSDITFPAHAVAKLFMDEKDIVGCNYNSRRAPHESTLRVHDGNKYQPPSSIPADLFKVDAMGMGLVLIKMSVFDKLQTPYFNFIGHGKDLIGEDVYFCEKAKEAGFDVWCDPTIKVGHIGTTIF